MRRTCTDWATTSPRSQRKSAERSRTLAFRQSQRNSETTDSPADLERNRSSWQYASPDSLPTPRKPREFVPRFTLAPNEVSRLSNSAADMPVPLSRIVTVRFSMSISISTVPVSLGLRHLFDGLHLSRPLRSECIHDRSPADRRYIALLRNFQNVLADDDWLARNDHGVSGVCRFYQCGAHTCEWVLQ